MNENLDHLMLILFYGNENDKKFKVFKKKFDSIEDLYKELIEYDRIKKREKLRNMVELFLARGDEYNHGNTVDKILDFFEEFEKQKETK